MTYCRFLYFVFFLCFIAIFLHSNTYAQDSNSLLSEDQVDLLADEVLYDENAEIVTARGNVELSQTGRILKANQISYDISNDKVEASGNIVLNELTGDVYFAETLSLTDQMKNGFVAGLRGVLADGSRFSAEQGEKIDDIKVILDKATYTACEPCKNDPDKAPIWQIKARNVTHHKDESKISYDDATFEVVGVPVAYTPYFSHPDGSVKRKSGLLTPSLGFDSQIGAFYNQEYYWNISPSQDATIGAKVMTDANPLVTGEYRKRFENAEVNLNAGVTYNERQDFVNGQEVTKDDDIRGHIFAEGLLDINEKWRAGADINYVSDTQYLSKYNFSSEDVLESKIFAERFDDRDYALARVIRFRDLRESDRAEDQPNILPEFYSSFTGAPNSALGGRFDLELSALNLAREGRDQDLLRGTGQAGWEKRHVAQIGLVNNVDLNLRGDVYRANDREASQAGIDNDTNEFRTFANANYKVSYPLIKQTEKTQFIVEPVAAVNLGTEIDEGENDIPNEDSEDTFLDATNIFNDNRFPGYDRIEDGSHTTYGMRFSGHRNNGNKAEVFVGQSYRFDDDNLFPKGSGLSEQRSDYVGAISADVGERLNVTYATRLDNDDLSSKRHELDLRSSFDKVDFNLRYFYANALQGTDLNDDREQIQAFGRYHFDDNWSAYSGIQYDLAEETKGLRRFQYGLDYQGQCVTLGIGGERELTRDFSSDSGTTILVRLGLRNLGNFETSDISLGGNEE